MKYKIHSNKEENMHDMHEEYTKGCPICKEIDNIYKKHAKSEVLK